MSATLEQPRATEPAHGRPITHLGEPEKNPTHGICGAPIQGVPAHGVWRLCERCAALREAIGG